MMSMAEDFTMTRAISAPPLDVDAPEYSSRQVAAATGVSLTVLSNWVGRENPTITFADGVDSPGESNGVAHWFSFRRLIQVAITHRLVKTFAMKPRRASLIALAFTDTGTYGGPGDPDAAGEMREPGKLFKNGLTYLVGTGGDLGRVVNVKLPAPGVAGTPLVQVFMSPDSHGAAAVVVNINQVVREVMHRIAGA